MINEGALNIPQRALWKFLNENWENPTTNVGTIPKEQYYFNDKYPNIVIYYQTTGSYQHRLIITKSASGLSLPFSTEMTTKELLAIVKNIR